MFSGRCHLGPIHQFPKAVGAIHYWADTEVRRFCGKLTYVKQALAQALEAKGYELLTAVQEAVTASEVLGKDLLVSAQTGSGKTIGFGLAIAHGLFGEDEAFAPAAKPLALIIAPTRELALQVKRELAWLYAGTNATLASTVGGMDMREERRALERGAHIVVATPGRLRDHIMRGSIDLTCLKAVVLDEADEMLDLGFREDLEFILEKSPTERQTLMFSATVSASIARLAQNYQKDAIRIATTNGASQHADIEYRALNVSARDGENAIINVLRYYEAPNAIVFCNTRAMVNRLTTRLSNRGFSVVALSGELSQSERTHALQAMRDGRAQVCVATDVAARGIDLPNLELVIHAELPTNQDTLLHRSGRTGRAGRKGVSALIVPPAAQKKAQRLLGWAKLKAEWGAAPSAEDVTAKDDARMLANSDWTDPVEPSNTTIVNDVVARFTPEQIATAYVRLYRAKRSAPEELSDPSTPPKRHKTFGPSVWFSLDGGHKANAEPRRLLPMLCKMGNISREDVGAIRIQMDASLIEIREAAVKGFLSAVGPKMALENGAKLVQMKAAPNLDRGPAKGKRAQAPDKTNGSGKKPGGHKTRAVGQLAAQDTQGATPPIDWNDAPIPRKKKPKPGTKPVVASKPRSARPQNEPGRAEKWKPHKATGGSKTSDGPSEKPRGPKPPAGKPTSKKNRARKLAKSTARNKN